MGLRLGDLASWVEGKVEGDPDRIIRGIQPLADAGPDDLSFLGHPRYRKQLESSRAGAVLVPHGLELAGRDLVRVEDPYYALAVILSRLHPPEVPPRGIHPTAILGEDVEVDPSASVGAYVVIGRGSRVEREAALHAHVVLGADCRIGEGALVYPRVVLYDRTVVGARSILHAGVVLGGDGFGYATREGRHVKIPQVGCVVVEEEVEIGANSTVDRASLGETRIGAGSKIDNLVQVGHNVRIGRSCFLVSQAGVAGSSRLGDGVAVGGQAGIAGHLEIGSGVQIAAKSAVFKSVGDALKVGGIPAVEISSWRRQAALLGRLEEFVRRIRELERKLDS